MITRSKLVEQLRDYQIRSQHKCPALTVFSPKPILTTCSMHSLVDEARKLHISRAVGNPSLFGASTNTDGLLWCAKDLRSDVVLAVFFAVLFGALIISSYLTLYLRYYWISFVIICIGVFLPWRLRITRQALARKKERLLPLSF